MPNGNAIGMSVPGASDLMGRNSTADQVAGETEEQRKKRLQRLQAAQQLPAGVSSLGQGYGSALGGS